MTGSHNAHSAEILDSCVVCVLVLRQLEARYQMNALPLRIETPSQIRRKNALEAKLQEIEEAIKVFDKTRVYVHPPKSGSVSSNVGSYAGDDSASVDLS